MENFLKRKAISPGTSSGVICAIKREALAQVTNKDMIVRFQKIKTRRQHYRLELLNCSSFIYTSHILAQYGEM